MAKKNSHKHPSETAGRLMTEKVPQVNEKATITDVKELLFKEINRFKTINYIYILSANKELRGVVSIKEIFRSPGDTPVTKLSPPKIISVRAHTDQEKVAFLALQHNLKAIPVVDKNNRFLGVVTSDSILHILDNEAVEDILRFGGALHRGPYDNILNIPLALSIKHRLPWLLLGLIGGMIAAGIVSRFEEMLSQNLILAAFIPLVVYMADAVGTQMEAFMVRDLAIMPKMKFRNYFFRQISVVFVIDLIITFLLVGGIWGLYGEEKIGLTVGAALFFAVLTSVFTGMIVPYIFSKLKLDPANASGPIATIIQDILSVGVYFLIASWLL